jgi:hypothetical protein
MLRGELGFRGIGGQQRGDHRVKPGGRLWPILALSRRMTAARRPMDLGNLAGTARVVSYQGQRLVHPQRRAQAYNRPPAAGKKPPPSRPFWDHHRGYRPRWMKVIHYDPSAVRNPEGFAPSIASCAAIILP